MYMYMYVCMYMYMHTVCTYAVVLYPLPHHLHTVLVTTSLYIMYIQCIYFIIYM